MRLIDVVCFGALLALAVALRLNGNIWVDDTMGFAGGCDEPFLLQIAPILETGNPLHFEVFYYPPVPAVMVAAFAGVWRMFGGGGTLNAQCGFVGLLLSVATVALVYMVGRCWGRTHGLIAMAFYAVTMMPVVTQGNVQVYSTFFLTLAMYVALRPRNDARIGGIVLAAVWLGLAVASKYSPVFLFGFLFIPYALCKWTTEGSTGCDKPADEGGNESIFSARMWTVSIWIVVTFSVVTLWLSIAHEDLLFSVLRQVYDRHVHENPFEYHLPWIVRLYRAGQVGVSLVGLTSGLALLIPWIRRISPWPWARSFMLRNRLWLAPCAAFVLTIAITIGLPALLNLNDFTRHFVHILKGRVTGDNGIFPTFRPAPSYIGAYIPESTGLLLFVSGLIGVLYPFIRRDKKALLLIVAALPAYLALELSRVKVNRYAMDLFPVWCVFAALWLGDLWTHHRKALRVVSIAVILTIVSYSAAYSLAWVSFFHPHIDTQTAAGRWLNTVVPPGTSVGVRSALIVNGSPELLPNSVFLSPYRLVDYTDSPEYVLLPNLVHDVILQYLEGRRQGYHYTEADWFLSTPSVTDLDVLTRIVRQENYVLVREFRNRPTLFGVEIGSNSITGRTWLIEHNAGVGLRIYRRAQAHNE